ncbi:DUF4244 domain-containing protein [Bifidobacterium xylocopae]|uniref:DUF4244 domain-containing protein n=1 Tax=Bifidobacterium xylocopae TaxID=2493119 RepID=UPI001F38E31C|nr:DUF4244 domain-containing protein [Bifidobacterium xylocopae]
MTVMQFIPSAIATRPSEVLTPSQEVESPGRSVGLFGSGRRFMARVARRAWKVVGRLRRSSAKAATRAVCEIGSRVRKLAVEPESGAATAEYAVVLIAATAFAGLLLAIMKSGTVRSLLLALVQRALNVA